MGSKNIRACGSDYRGAVLLQTGEEVVLEEFADGGSLVWVFVQADHHEVFCCLGDHYLVGEVDLLLDLCGGMRTILTMSFICRI